MAARAGNRMQARQTYRTINRMERRRALFDRAFDGDDRHAPEAPSPSVAPVPSYVVEIEQLARLRDQGLLSAEEFEVKRRQLLSL